MVNGHKPAYNKEQGVGHPSFDHDLPTMALFYNDLEMFGGENLQITQYRRKKAKKANSQTHASTQTHFASSQ